MSSRRIPRTRPLWWRDQQGITLIAALMALLLLSALGLALALAAETEITIGSAFSVAVEALYAADAGIERAMQDLLTVSDWNTVLDGTVTSAFVDGAPSGVRTLWDGRTLDLSQVLALANCGKPTSCTVADMHAVTDDRPWGLDNPRWRLYAYGRLNDLVPAGTADSPFYVVVMAGDDAAETDHDPTRDTNGIIALRAEAFGPFNSHKVIVATVARADAGTGEGGYTGQVGQNEQNRPGRTAPVQTPGKSLAVVEVPIARPGK